MTVNSGILAFKNLTLLQKGWDCPICNERVTGYNFQKMIYFFLRRLILP